MNKLNNTFDRRTNMHSRHHNIVFIFLLILEVHGGSAFADVTACFENWPPYQLGSPTGEVSGISVALTDRVMSQLGQRVAYQPLPYRRCLNDVRRGRIDMLLSSQGEPDLRLVSPAKVVWAIGLFVRRDDPRSAISNLADLNGLKVGVAQQFALPPPLAAFQGWRLEALGDDRLNFQKLSRGRIDAVLTDAPWAMGLSPAERVGARLLRPLVAVVEQPDAFRPGLESLRDAYAAGLAKLFADGVVDRIYQDKLAVTFEALSAGALVRN